MPIVAKPPGEGGDDESDGGVPSTNLVGEAAEAGAFEFAVLHDAHDLGVAGILGAAKDFDFEEGGAVAGTGDDFRTGGLFDVVGFAGEEAFVHAALAFDDDRVGRGDLIGED